MSKRRAGSAAEERKAKPHDLLVQRHRGDTGTALARGRLMIISVVSCISCVIEPDNWNKVAPDSSPTTSAEKCYVVDEDPSVRKSITRLFELEEFEVFAFGDPKDFLNQMATNPVRLVVLDIWMQQMTGMELLAHLCARWPGTRVIFITGHEDRAAEATVMRAGASGFFIKPLDNEKFIAAVQDALKQA